VEQAYETSVSIRFVASADTADAAEEVASAFASQLAAWIDGSLGSPPFAPWLTAWVEGAPTVLQLDATAWPLRPVTADDLATERPWGDNR
jgi:hypothetical protein